MWEIESFRHGGAESPRRETLRGSKGGLIDKAYNPTNGGASGFSPFAVTGNSNVNMLMKHETHHVWQSRAMGDRFAFSFGLQGISGLIRRGFNTRWRDYEGHYYEGSSAVSPGNYYEAIPYLYPWWY